MLIGGKLGDLYGRKPLFILSLIIFGLGSLAVGASMNATMIIGFRALQGIGAAVLAPNCLALLTDTFEGQARQKVIGYYASVIGAGAAIGLVIGGIFATFASWRIGFYINGPIAFIMVIIALKVLAKPEKQTGNLDWLGTILSILAMTSISYGLDGSPWRVPTLIVSLVFWIAFIYSQGRVNHPTMPLEIFKDRERTASYLSSLLFSSAGIGFWFYTPQFMQRSLGYSPFVTALGMVPMAVLLFVIAVPGKKIGAKVGKCTCYGHWLYCGHPIYGRVIRYCSFGKLLVAPNWNTWICSRFCISFRNTCYFRTCQNPHRNFGAASGVYNTARQFGGALGLAIFAAFTEKLTGISDVFGKSMLIGVGLTFVGLILVLIFIVPMERK